MATIEQINAEIAKRQQAQAIDDEISRRQAQVSTASVQQSALLGNRSNLDATLSQPTATDILSRITPDPGGLVSSVVEPAAAIASGVAAEIPAGLAGIAEQAFGDPSDVTKTIQSTREALTFQPRTEIGQRSLAALGEAIKPVGEAFQAAERTLGESVLEATGSPELAALAHTLPSAALELLGVRATKRASDVADGVSRQVKSFERQGFRSKRFQQSPVSDADLETISKTILTGNPEEISRLVDADPEFFRAADELGINTEPLASFSSRNPQFVAVESGLASVPASALDVQTKAFIGDLSKRADGIIEEFGGTLDKAQLGDDFKRTSLATVDDLFQQADDTYAKLAQILPKSGRFPATNTVDFILSKADELGGANNLPPKLKRVLSRLAPKEGKSTVSAVTGARSADEINPTLGSIDQMRREVGQAINKGTGPFKDVESGLNKALYARLTKDQDAIAELSGIDGALGVSDAGKALVRQRKQIEDNLVILLGKDLNKSLSINVGGAVKGLAKGDVNRFREVIGAIPKTQRGEVVLSALNDVFRGTGVGQQALNPTQFTRWFQNVNRSPLVKKELFAALPDGSQRAVENLFKVTSGVTRALGDRVPTGRLNAMFNPETGFVRRMVGKAAPGLVAFATGSPTAAVLTNASVDFLKQGTDGAKRASDLMASSQFQSVIRRAVKEGVTEGKAASQGLNKAVSALEKTGPYKRWAREIGSVEPKAVAPGVLLDYLFREDFNTEQQ